MGDPAACEVELLLLWVVIRVRVELVLDLEAARGSREARDRSIWWY